MYKLQLRENDILSRKKIENGNEGNWVTKQEKKKRSVLCFVFSKTTFSSKLRLLHATDQMLSFSNISGRLTAWREAGIWQPCPCQGERHDFLKWVNLDFSFLSAGETFKGCLLGGAGRWMMVVIWWKSTISHAWRSEKNKVGQKSEKTRSMNCKMQKQRGCFPVNSPRG